MKEYIVALTTCPAVQGHSLARILVDKQVCACVNIIPGVRSFYYWNDKITEDSEVILLIKTEAKLEKMLQDAVFENHPYELPEFIVLDIKSGSKNYLDWISANILKD